MIGFGSDLLNPTQIMPFIRPALVSIFSAGLDPWDTVLNWCTVNSMALTHTPIVVVDRDDEGQARGRQVLYSTGREQPFGFTPQCGSGRCVSYRNDVYGSKHTDTKKSGVHTKISLQCKRCEYHAWVKRPDWMTPAHDSRPHYFVAPWPLTAAQIGAAQGADAVWLAKGESSAKDASSDKGESSA